MRPCDFCLELVKAILGVHWGSALSGLAREGNKRETVNEAECE